MASKKKSDGSGIQQAAGLIRYFDEESEDAWKITPFQVYAACIGVGTFFYLVNQGVIQWIINPNRYQNELLHDTHHHNTDQHT